MFHRKLTKLWESQIPVAVFLSDQGRWVNHARVVEVAGDTSTFQYTEEDGDDICVAIETVRIENIGSILIQIATLSTDPEHEPEVSDDCPEIEKISN